MNFQEKMLETAAALRARAAKRIPVLKGSLSALAVAGSEFGKVARRHAIRFVKENSSLASDAGKEVSALARTTYASLADRPTLNQKARKAPRARKRVAAKRA